MPMREIVKEEYQQFAGQHRHAVINGVKVLLRANKKVPLLEPVEFQLDRTTVWSFEDRGKWATHQGNYRGNWAPQIPRNLLLRYTKPGELVLDQMVGSGTTLVECKLLGRNGIGVDINYEALMVTWNRLDFDYDNGNFPPTRQTLYQGDARNLDLIDQDSVDLVATHPPYANIIPYSHRKSQEADLSTVHSLEEFVQGMSKVAGECWRVLKPGKHCAILIGDTHRHKHYVPIAYRVLEVFLDRGFILREDVIKRQWHTQTMRGRWRESHEHDFLLIFHEHLFIFRRPDVGENPRKFRASMKWWTSREGAADE